MGAVSVRFARSETTADWSPGKGSLLELAEVGRIGAGLWLPLRDLRDLRHADLERAVEYIEEPLAPRGDGQVLLCCSVPANPAGTAAAAPGIVLDL